MPDEDGGGVPDGADLVAVGTAAKMLGCSTVAIKKLAQARNPKVRGLAPGQGRNHSHQWVFVRGDVEQRAILMGRSPTPAMDLRADRDNLVAAYELAEQGRHQEREDRLLAMVADGQRRIAELEAERERLWDALEHGRRQIEALRPTRSVSAT
ncbi:MAG: hypothetical protein M3083_18165 [Actinomycetota bacterium]|nr:hypothetical protein [Actinomycetota bacterium]